MYRRMYKCCVRLRGYKPAGVKNRVFEGVMWRTEREMVVLLPVPVGDGGGGGAGTPLGGGGGDGVVACSGRGNASVRNTYRLKVQSLPTF